MPKYIALLRWTNDGIKNVSQSSSRLDSAKALLTAAGGQFESLYMTLGDYDMIAILSAPDDATVARFALSVGAQGSVRTKTLRAFGEDEYRDLTSSVG